ncbi:hypothetical protein F2P81_020516 [Scophthalmus maximus]|uniref:Uncharacterized protein n=1 Tax=Scophthalmus maximus TaxID=52904 RepID=A0A6A4S672_SCOMX|nr:hypothetical protein F2P81_020516 [Scophthalmus maximus]
MNYAAWRDESFLRFKAMGAVIGFSRTPSAEPSGIKGAGIELEDRRRYSATVPDERCVHDENRSNNNLFFSPGPMLFDTRVPVSPSHSLIMYRRHCGDSSTVKLCICSVAHVQHQPLALQLFPC